MSLNMNDKVYDVLKWIAMYLLPAIGTLYFTLGGIWNFPYGEEVVGTITAIDTFLGALLGLSNISYRRGNGNPQVPPTINNNNNNVQ